jgi:hypothetical protein
LPRWREALTTIALKQATPFVSVAYRNGYAPTESESGKLNIDPKRVSDDTSERNHLA